MSSWQTLDATDRRVKYPTAQKGFATKRQNSERRPLSASRAEVRKKSYPATCTTAWLKKKKAGKLTEGNRRLPQPPPQPTPRPPGSASPAPPVGPVSKSRAFTQTSGVPDTTSKGAHGAWSIAHVRPSLSYTSRDRVFLTPENESDSTSKKAKTSRGNGGGAVVAHPKSTARGLSLGGRLIARSPPGAC